MRKTQVELQRRWAKKKMADPMWREIARRYQAGETCKGLALDFGLERETVRNVVGRLGLRQTKLTPELKEMIRLYEGGCSLEEIARLFECTKQNVSLRLRPWTKMRKPTSHRRPGYPDLIARGEW